MNTKSTSPHCSLDLNTIDELLSASPDTYRFFYNTAGFCIKTTSNNYLLLESLQNLFGVIINNRASNHPDYEGIFICTENDIISYVKPQSLNVVRTIGRYQVSLSLDSTIHAEVRDEVDCCVCGTFQAGIDKAIAIISESYCRTKVIRQIFCCLLGSALMGFFRAKGFVILHTAGVVSDNNAVLITGDSGSGKSTTSLLLSNVGYDWLCDDLALILYKDGEFDIFDFPAGMVGIPNVCVPRIKGLYGLVKSSNLIELDRLNRYRTTTKNILDVIGARKVEQAKLALMLFPEIQPHAKCEIFPLKDSTAIEKVLQFDGFFFSKAHIINSVSTILRLVKQVNKYHLILGNDLNNLPSLLDRLIGNK